MTRLPDAELRHTAGVMRQGSGGRRPGQRLRVAVLADMREEQWPSMELVAAALVRELRTQADLGIEPLLVQPRLVPVLPPWRRDSIVTSDRVLNRFWLYRRALPRARSVDLYHVVDHSYAHLALHVPAGRCLVTCHDVDAFAGHARPQGSAGLPPFLVRRLIAGLRRAAIVVCPSRATARSLLAAGLVDEHRLVVVPNGVDLPPMTDGQAERLTEAWLGRADGPELLHVGSTIPRKRIDVLLRTVAAVVASVPGARLVRVGGPFTADQAALVAALGLGSRTIVLPPIDGETLAALYRRAALLLATSEREGFGLPVAEALSAGTPVVATDLPVFREVAGDAAEYAACGDVAAWSTAVMRLLDERRTSPDAWRERRTRARARGALYSWAKYGREMAALYASLARGHAAPIRAAAAGTLATP